MRQLVPLLREPRQQNKTAHATMSSAVDAVKQLRSIIATLRQELALLQIVIVKHLNQHRRTLYWRAFRELHKLSERTVVGVLEPLVKQGSASSPATVSSSLQRCEDAERRSLGLAKRIAAPHQGAGFAALAAVLVASTAVYCEQLRAARTAVQALVQARQGSSAGHEPAAPSSVAPTSQSSAPVPDIPPAPAPAPAKGASSSGAGSAPAASAGVKRPAGPSLPVPGANKKKKKDREAAGPLFVIDKGQS